MSDKSTLNELQPRKKKKKSVIGFVIAIVFLSLITLASLAVAYQSVKLYKDEVKKNEEAPVAEVTYTKEEVDEMVKLAREDAAEQATAGFYAELKDTAENSNYECVEEPSREVDRSVAACSAEQIDVVFKCEFVRNQVVNRYITFSAE